MPERKVVSPEYMLFNAPREKKYLIGNETVAEAVKRANVILCPFITVCDQMGG